MERFLFFRILREWLLLWCRLRKQRILWRVSFKLVHQKQHFIFIFPLGTMEIMDIGTAAVHITGATDHITIIIPAIIER